MSIKKRFFRFFETEDVIPLVTSVVGLLVGLVVSVYINQVVDDSMDEEGEWPTEN